MGEDDMLRRKIMICAALLAAFAFTVSGCSKSKAPVGSISEQTSVIMGDTYTVPFKDHKFYCMRVKDSYYKFEYTGSSAELLSADDPCLFPDLKDGEFARVTADLEGTYSDFGYVPIITTISTKITKLKDFEPMEYEDVTRVFNLPSADTKEINRYSKLFLYTHKGKLYLLLKHDGRITAYTKDGLFIDYEQEDKTDLFKPFFDALK